MFVLGNLFDEKDMYIPSSWDVWPTYVKRTNVQGHMSDIYPSWVFTSCIPELWKFLFVSMNYNSFRLQNLGSLGEFDPTKWSKNDTDVKENWSTVKKPFLAPGWSKSLMIHDIYCSFILRKDWQHGWFWHQYIITLLDQ